MTEERLPAAASRESTMRKLGAHLRWAVEREGIDPESVAVVVLVKDRDDLARIIAGAGRDMDGTAVVKGGDAPGRFILHGVRVSFILAAEGAP